MGIQAQEVDLRQVYNWALRLEGANGLIDTAYMSECDNPAFEIESVAFSQAGAIHDINNPGRIKFTPIVFKKGMWLGGADRNLYDWFISGANPATGTTRAPSLLKKEAQLAHLDGDGNDIEVFVLKGAWTSKLEMSKLEGKSDYLFEMGTLTYDWASRQ